uniref:G patch domain-containing protein 4 n=1 Tax=Labrus bergylta TaxID=56723 RepID=A0A3Q3MLM5_9LABR|nr:G patch domain-containing protein 4-like [Labrus bergylta]
MAEVVQEKSRGLKFAEQQLLRHGWEHGKGLGRAENGISEAIKVKVKCDKGGVGHKEGEQFTFHWWDHVFNKASSSLQVESDQSGIKLKKTVEEDEEEGMISNKMPRKASLAKAKLYGCFVKSATLLSGQEQPEPKASNSDDSSSSSDDEEDEQKMDLSSTFNKLTDADLMKACGGRTAHKGARHGMTMSAKLLRLEQQEAEFMAKYGKKKQPANSPSTPAPSQSPEQRAERCEETAEEPRSKKMKKRKSTGSIDELNVDKAPSSPETDEIPKKKKKKGSEKKEEIIDAVSPDEDVIFVGNVQAERPHKTKRKDKKKKKSAEQNEEEEGTSSPAAESPEETTELHADATVKKKKKKKKKSSKHQSEPAEGQESNVAESSQSEPAEVSVLTAEKKKRADKLDKAEVTEEESTVRQKRKKCKKDKTSVEDIVNEEALPPKKKKKKSKE